MEKFLLAGAIAALTLSFHLMEGAKAADIDGTWLRENGRSRVRFAACGVAVCGTIIWLKEPDLDKHNPDEALRKRSLVGVQVFFDMKASGSNKWSGKAYNPEDGRTYSGFMTLDGGGLTTQGCVLGGIICKSVTWTRVN